MRPNTVITLPTISIPVITSHFNLWDVDDVVNALQQFQWTVQPVNDGAGKVAFATCNPKSPSGELWQLAVLQNAVAPVHTHGEGGVVGEILWTYQGELHDRNDNGDSVVVGKGAFLIHAPGTTHAPHAMGGFWFGAFFQPYGCRFTQ